MEGPEPACAQGFGSKALTCSSMPSLWLGRWWLHGNGGAMRSAPGGAFFFDDEQIVIEQA